MQGFVLRAKAQMGQQLVTRRKLRDFVIYVFAAITLVLFITWAAIRAGQGGSNPALPLKWVGFAAFSALAFGYPIRTFRRSWRNFKFRRALAGLVVVHLAVLTPLLATAQSVPLIWYLVGAIVESGIISGCFAWVLRGEP